MNTSAKTIRFGVRATRGQALLAGTMLMPLFVFAAVLLILFTLNTAVLGNCQGQLQSVANEAARQIVAKRWWIGMSRPGQISPAKLEDEAKQSINAELETMHLSSLENFRYRRITRLVNGKETEFALVSFDVPGLRMISGGILPTATKMHVSGISSNSEQASVMHGMALIHVIDPVTKEEKGLRVPIYTATEGPSTPLNRNILSTGVSAGIYPVAYLRLQCPNSHAIYTQRNP